MKPSIMKDLFISTLKAHNQIFDDYKEIDDETVSLYYRDCDNTDEITIMVTFGELNDGGGLATIGCYDLPNFSHNLAAGIRACNQLNDDEIVKYYIDKDGDAIANLSLFFEAYNIPLDYSPNQVLLYATAMALSADTAFEVLKAAY